MERWHTIAHARAHARTARQKCGHEREYTELAPDGGTLVPQTIKNCNYQDAHPAAVCARLFVSMQCFHPDARVVWSTACTRCAPSLVQACSVSCFLAVPAACVAAACTPPVASRPQCAASHLLCSTANCQSCTPPLLSPPSRVCRPPLMRHVHGVCRLLFHVVSAPFTSMLPLCCDRTQVHVAILRVNARKQLHINPRCAVPSACRQLQWRARCAWAACPLV